jgi:arylformamidase
VRGLALSLHGGSDSFRVAESGISLAIDQTFAQDQPSHFGVPPATRQPYAAGEFIGDTRRGGSCNVDVVQLIPHCNGTHTETAGHILSQSMPVSSCLLEGWCLARLVSVVPVRASSTGDHYEPASSPDDLVIDERAVTTAFAASLPAPLNHRPTALIVRTLPNDPAKRSRNWSTGPLPPYFSAPAIEAMRVAGVEHLLVDLPSIDRMHDQGRMFNHCLFWEVDPDQRLPQNPGALNRTVTEMIFVPAEVEDGIWLLNLQVAPFAIDAAPSRPVVFGLEHERRSR